MIDTALTSLKDHNDERIAHHMKMLNYYLNESRELKRLNTNGYSLRQKSRVVNGKRQFYQVELTPYAEDHGSHWRIYAEKDSSPLILSKNEGK